MKVNPLHLDLLNQANNIPVILPSSPLEIEGKSVKSFDIQTYKHQKHIKLLYIVIQIAYKQQ